MRRLKKSAAFLAALFLLSCPVVGSAEEGVHIHGADVPVKDLLRGLADMAERNIIFSGELSGTVTASLDDITADEAFSAVAAAAGLAIRTEGQTVIVYDGDSQDKGARSVESFRLSYADAEETAEELKVLADAKRISFDGASNTVILSGSAVELMQARSLLTRLDQPQKQVKVEAEVLAVNSSYAKELGVDWDFKSLTGSAEYNRDSWSEQRYVTDDTGNIKYDKDGNPRIRNIEHNGWEITAPEGYAGISYGKSVTGHPYTFFFQAKLNALISDGKARILAKPNLVTLNGRQAKILIGSKIPVLVEHMENGVKTTSVEYKDAGIKLSYKPRISDGGDITADIEAEVSTPYLVPEMKAYRIITRQAQTMVRLKSGDMITIGGLIDKETTNVFRKVPILGDIPLLGKLFQSKHTSEEESEIIIIIRADIVE